MWLYNKTTKTFNPKVIQIFKKWFVEFSSDSKMDVKAIANFILIVTEQHRNKQRSEKFLRKWDKDSKGYISEEDFLMFYKNSMVSSIDIVWQNLNSRGYNNELLLPEEIVEKQIDVKLLARYLLIMDNEKFQAIFEMLNMED